MDLDSLRIQLDHCMWAIDHDLDKRDRAGFEQHTWRRRQLLQQLEEAACRGSVESPTSKPLPGAP